MRPLCETESACKGAFQAALRAAAGVLPDGHSGVLVSADLAHAEVFNLFGGADADFFVVQGQLKMTGLYSILFQTRRLIHFFQSH